MAQVARGFEQDILRRYENWTVYLHQNQSYLGRSYIALARGEDDEEMDPFIDTTAEEREELQTVTSGLKTALDELYQPTRLNYANLRNHWRRCHWHVIPRYEGEDFGLRVVSGFDFHDMNPGGSYAPAPSLELPPKVFSQIHTDMSEALASMG